MTMPNIVSAQDGPTVTVRTMAKSPTAIPRRVLSMMNQEFITDAVLRKGGALPSGMMLYFESTPLFTAVDPQVMDEFGQIPVTNGTVGKPRVVRAVRRAMGLRVSKQMIDRNDVEAVDTQITQIRNTMIRSWEDALFSALLANANIQTLTTDHNWGTTGSHMRKDINAAKFLIKNAASDTAGKQKMGFVADTLIINTETEMDMQNSAEVSLPYVGNLASENLLYTGKLPNKFLGLDVLVSWRMAVYAPSGAIVCQRKVMGVIGDERPLSATGMYPEGGGGNGGPTESFRTDITRASAIAIDQPKSVVLISGVTDGETLPVSGGTITLTS